VAHRGKRAIAYRGMVVSSAGLTATLYAFIFYPKHATCPVYLMLHHRLTRPIWSAAQISKLLLMQTLPVPCHFLPPRPTHFAQLFSNTFTPCYSLTLWDQVSHPYKTRGKIMVLCISIMCFYRQQTAWLYSEPNYYYYYYYYYLFMFI